jgi:hypothetical protein
MLFIKNLRHYLAAIYHGHLDMRTILRGVKILITGSDLRHTSVTHLALAMTVAIRLSMPRLSTTQRKPAAILYSL